MNHLKKGRIDRHGFLLIRIPRKGGPVFAKIICIYREGCCGDLCPFFGTPQEVTIIQEDRDKAVALQTCKKTLYFSELIDERHPDMGEL
jgi:hypothetical protein